MTTFTSGTITPYRSELPGRPAGFPQLVRSEWTKLRTVRGWLVGLVAAAVLTVSVGLLSALGSNMSCAGGPGPSGGAGTAAPSGGGESTVGCRPSASPLGPGGAAVTDNFTFVHQILPGDGSITVAVTSFIGLIPAVLPDQEENSAAEGQGAPHPGLVPWAKAGLIIKDGTAQGSAYAAIMVTGNHGVRMQYDYTQDIGGAPNADTPNTVSADHPRWLRLTRSGDTVTGEESPDGTNWTQVGSATLTGLPSTVQVGMFVASPEYEVTNQTFGASSSTGGPSQATATFDQVSVQNGSTAGQWITDAVGGGGIPVEPAIETNGVFTVSGSGDIAPKVGGPGPNTVERSGIGTFAGLIVLIVIGTGFITVEYRRGLIRTTFAANQGRGRVLAAKALVLGAAGFATGLVAAAVCMWLVGWIQRQNGVSVVPVPWLTEVRVVLGTAALFAVVAVLALAVGAALRRSAGAVAIAVVLVVLPYILAVASVLPVGAAQWLLRLSPAAGFAIQQSIPEYAQVDAFYAPSTGYFPLSPLAGFGVLCLWTAAAFVVAVVLVRRRDA